MANLFGKWAFIIGFIIAIITGIPSINGGWVPYLLVILGLVVGFLNISEKETKGFLIASIALLVAASATMAALGAASASWAWVYTILKNLVFFISAAALVVSLRSLFVMAKD